MLQQQVGYVGVPHSCCMVQSSSSILVSAIHCHPMRIIQLPVFNGGTLLAIAERMAELSFGCFRLLLFLL